jgi:GMP synthase-like glutamine amidotransferase
MDKKIFKIILLTLFLTNFAFCQFRDADLNQDGVVNSYDLIPIMNFWLSDCYESPCYNVDINQDGTVDFYDFTFLSKFWKVTNNNSYQVAYWPLNETTGTTIYDKTPNGHNASMKNMTTSDHVSGKRGYALDFDGTDDYLWISAKSNGMGQYFTKDFSIAMWVYKIASSSQYETLIGIESTSRYTTYGYEGFTIELDNGVPVMYIADSNEYMETTYANFAFTNNQWQHLCIIREGGNLKFYLDGKLQSSKTINNVNIRFGSIWPGYDVIGETFDSCYGHNATFKGRLDDIHLYNYAIPQSLVHKIAQQDYAWLPTPENASVGNSLDTSLLWQKGVFAVSENCHDVYFGTSGSEVLNATTSATGIYKGRQTSRLFDPVQLIPNTNYYWRIDDVNGSSVHTGNVWSFKTSDEIFATSSSSSQIGYQSSGAYDQTRFAADLGQCWKGSYNENTWYWQIYFEQPKQIGSLLMIMGEPGQTNSELQFYQLNAPLNYIWQYSNDETTWTNISETQVTNERRTFRIQRFNNEITAKYFRLSITDCIGLYPTIREIEFYSNTNSQISFDDWIVAVDITNEQDAPYGNTSWFIARARQCDNWTNVQGQQIWVDDFDEAFLYIEPYPMCVFVSGSFDEWCQVTREFFTGMQEVLVNGNIPMWGSCGGAQMMGLLLEPGCENRWDCPRCRVRENHNPAWSPIYGYIGYKNNSIEPLACVSYSNNVYEIGDYLITQEVGDQALNGLTNPFYGYEYHCGQLNYLPAGWTQICGAGSDTLTQMQCFRRDDRYIYGAQFHIENDSSNSTTNANSVIIMTNFLNIAHNWGGYHPPQ